MAGDSGASFATAVQEVLGRPVRRRRQAARARAACFGWDTAVRAFLASHEAPARTPGRGAV